jgi:hypothetical protein
VLVTAISPDFEDQFDVSIRLIVTEEPAWPVYAHLNLGGDNFVSLEQFDGSEVDLQISTTIGEKYSEAKLVTVLNAGAFR